jgi:hypothetical protein
MMADGVRLIPHRSSKSIPGSVASDIGVYQSLPETAQLSGYAAQFSKAVR